jgi:hypothetical protein
MESRAQYMGTALSFRYVASLVGNDRTEPTNSEWLSPQAIFGRQPRTVTRPIKASIRLCGSGVRVRNVYTAPVYE